MKINLKRHVQAKSGNNDFERELTDEGIYYTASYLVNEIAFSRVY
ncbi:MAG: hypothetical protein V1720_14475 [bacterium]